MNRCILPLLLVLSAFSCAHVVSNDLRSEADRSLDPGSLFSNPEAHKGKTVILGGIIASSRNAPEGTYVEVVHQPLDYRGRPHLTDNSLGRFIILYNGYLDTAIYSREKLLTVAGDVMGRTTLPLGDITYSYPLIQGRELHIIKPGYGNLPIHLGIGIGHSF